MLVSDLHIHPWQEHSVILPNGIPSRLADCVNVLAEVRTYCVEFGIKVVIIGGDLCHKRGVIYTQTYNLIVHELMKFKRLGIVVLIVDGNHDHANRSGTVHAVQALASADLVWSIPQDGWINWTLDDELIVSGFSYCDDRDLFKQRLAASNKNYRQYSRGTPRIGVMHHGFKGARVGTVLEYVVKEDIDPKYIADGFDYVFSGHYHTRQSIGSLPNATYIGSPLENTRGEGGNEKGFLIYDSNKKEWKLVPIKRPKFVQLTQRMIDSKDHEIAQGNYVDVVYNELPRDPDEFRERLLRKDGAIGVKLAPLTTKRYKAARQRLDVDLSLDSRTMLKRFLEHCGVSGEQKRKLLAHGIELLERAQS